MKTVSAEEWDGWLDGEKSRRISTYINYGIAINDFRFKEDFFHTGEVPLLFRNCFFERKFTLTDFKFSTNISFHNCIFDGAFYIGASKCSIDISFVNCSINGQAIFNQLAINSLELNLKYSSEIIFDDRCLFDNVLIGGMERNKLDNLIISAGIVTKRLEINHAEIGQLRIPSSTLKSEFVIANCHIHTLSIDNLRNLGFLKFINCRALSNRQSAILTINQSNLGRTEFFKFDFRSFKTVNICNSVLLDCIFINSKWSKSNFISQPLYFKEGLETDEEVSKRGKADNLREVLKQIKYALSKQGDGVQEQFFHGLEMNQYYKTLSFRKDFSTKMIIGLSYLTSNYGQSLVRPLICLFIANGVLFFLLFSFEGLSAEFSSIRTVPNLIAEVLNFINPLHKYDAKLHGYSLMIDIFGRIISSYLLYNIIRATRRFVK